MKTVYLYTGGIAKAHPVYQETSRYAPEGFLFTPAADDFFGPKKIAVGLPSFAAKLVDRTSPYLLNLAMALRVPKVRLIRTPQGVDLIHSGQYPLLNRTPWVVDFEQAVAFVWFSRTVLDSSITKRFFEHLFSGPSCRALIGWTSAAKQSLLNAFDCSRFKDKIHAVPFTIIPQPHVDRTKRKGTIEMLFCSGNFYCKGGLGAVRAAAVLIKNYDVHLTVVSQTPQEVLKEYSDNPRITFLERANTAQRYELMQKADIFLHPGHSETYGFVMLEAFSFGLPVITTDGFSGPEIVGDGVRGYAIKNYLSWFDEKLLPWVKTPEEKKFFFEALQDSPQDYINRLARATARLIEQKELRLQMGQNAYESITKGVFSPAYRKKRFGQIYKAALNQ